MADDLIALSQNIELANEIILKRYYSLLSAGEIEDLPEELIQFDFSKDIRVFKVERIIYDNKESIIDKLNSVYNSVYEFGNSLIMIINSDGINTSFYLGIRKLNGKDDINTSRKAFQDSLKGNFPGLVIKNDQSLDNSEVISLIKENIIECSHASGKTITSVSSLHSLKKDEKDGFIQGLEKLIEGNKDKKYTAVFIADPVEKYDISQIKYSLENLYTNLSPLAETSYNYGANQNISFTESLSNSISHSISESISKSTSYSEGRFESTTEGSSHSFTNGVNASVGIPFVASVGGNSSYGYATSSSKTDGINKSLTRSKGITNGSTDTKGVTKGKAYTDSIGYSENCEIKIENKTVKNLLERTQDNIDRLKDSESFGFWNFAGYFISDDYDSSISTANNYISLMRGKHSNIENSALNIWSSNQEEKVNKILKYLECLNHPRISLELNHNKVVLNPGVLINTNELIVAANLPRKSFPGLPITDMAEFGRSINFLNANVDKTNIIIGNIYHLGKEENNKVFLNLNKLSSHTFITGCTGSGKTNTVLNILEEAERYGIKYLVIEPAKGEYKIHLGGKAGVKVFGTNPNFTETLKMNPFSFPENIHVLEHLDRLIEIFNACWPMYAAMPAILKEAMENAYILKGWDIDNSNNLRDKSFPTFNDLLISVQQTIINSMYSENLKSDYSGALITRIKSLTNGLFKEIFSENEIDNDTLFNENCIVDISRIGSMETKSLIMGILFLKLKEFREANNIINSPLSHLTVLEEAHNLLKRTSTDFSQESGNLQGKAVEMIANSIAEMRTFGEGFIIADQSPGLLDQSVIRNTSTKIIMQLPEDVDREIAGNSCALNSDQKNEIARLENGVAIISQNNWITPVLCKIYKFSNGKSYIYSSENKNKQNKRKQIIRKTIELLLRHRIDQVESIDVDKNKINKLINDIQNLNLTKSTEKNIKEYLYQISLGESSYLQDEDCFPQLARLCCELVNLDWILINTPYNSSIIDYDTLLRKNLRHYVDLTDYNRLESCMVLCIFSVISEKGGDKFNNIYKKWAESIKQGEIVLW